MDNRNKFELFKSLAKMKTIIVTSTYGFIGGFIFKKLKKEYNVIGLEKNPPQCSRKDNHLVKVDITDKAEIDLVFKNIILMWLFIAPG